MTSNNLINAAEALILDICLKYTINPLQFKHILTGEPIDLHQFADEVYDHFTNNNTHYIAIYFNRDEPTISIEEANSRAEFLNIYDCEADQIDSIITLVETIEVTIDGITYTFDLLPDC